MKYRQWLPLMLFAAVSLALAACGGPAATPPAGGNDSSGQSGAGGQAASNTPKRGGILRPGTGGTSAWAQADPAMGQASYNGWPLIAEYVLRLSPDGQKVIPSGVEKWEFSADGLELTLKVRPGMKFHNKPPVNGREVEAKDIVYSLKGVAGMLYPELPSVRFPRRSELEQMTDVVAVDKYTVKLTLAEPSATILNGLAEYRSAMILPEGIREHFGGVEALATHDVNRSISAGPFIMTKFTDLVEVNYERNPDYWEKGVDGLPKPYLDGVRQLWIPDRGTLVAAFIAGQLDHLRISGVEERDLIVSQRKDARVEGYAPTSCWHRLAFNLNRKPFDDVRVRRAISLMLDPQVTGLQFFGEWEGKPLWRFPGPLPWVFPEALPQEELAKLPFAESPKSQKTIDEAKKLLADAGLASGFEFELLTISSSFDYKGVAALISDQLQKTLGNVKVRIKVVDNSINQQLAAKGEFDTQYYCHIHDSTGLTMMKTSYHSKGGRNYPRYNNPQMDKLLEDASRELNDAKRIQLMHQAQRLALEELPWMPITHYQSQLAVQPGLHGDGLGADSLHNVYVKDWWLGQ